MQINTYHKDQLFEKVSELINYISLTYSINVPDPEFIAHLANVLKKHYGFMTFDQAHMAFEYNSLGYLNQYLPKNGYSTDNKIRNFSIPDLAKVLRAFVQLKKLNEDGPGKNEKPTAEFLAKRFKEWNTFLSNIFEKYKQSGERTPFNAVVFVAEYLSRKGIVNPAEIDRSEPAISLSMGGKSNKRRHNENLIYQSFDKIINQGKNIDVFLNPNDMPY